jgi:DNA-binding CsgD family transcriptional regulator
MEVTTVPDPVDPVDRYIARLYRSALAVPTDEYRAWALREWANVVPHDGALWGGGNRISLKFHTRTVSGLPAEFPGVLEATASINPLLTRILQNLDTPVDMRSVLPDKEFFKSEIYRRAFEPFGITRILSTCHLDRRSGLYSLVTLYRKDRKQPFTEQEQAQQKRITFHLFNAASHSFFLHLARDRERPPNGGAAVVDSEGCFHQAQPRFIDLLEDQFPGRDPSVLPFAPPEPGATQVLGNLCVKSEPAGDMFIVYLWPAGPLDRLTQREREIVFAVAQGLSFKQAAKKIGVAPSTVANHLYRVYRKLGVYSRTELAALVHPKASS